MKKIIFLVLVVICAMLSLIATIITNPSSGTVYVGQNIGAQINCIDYCPSTMFWGDGTTTSGSDDFFYLTFRYHIYRNPGTFTMHFRRSPFTTPSCLVDEYKSVTILENRSITVSPAQPSVGLPITFTAINFKTPTDITWDMGDGTTYTHRGTTITHTYATDGSYRIRAFDWNGDTKTTPVSLTLKVAPVLRVITCSPEMPRVDQPVDIRAVGFKSDSIDWNFGDGSPLQTYSTLVSHRYQNPGTFIITAKEHGMEAALESKAIIVLPENRSLVLSIPELRMDEPLTVTALNFRGQLILWDFGDGTVVSGPATMTHIYKLPGNYLIIARDENGASEKKIQASVKILGINDQVNLEIAEITLDNGKYYKVVPKKSKNIRAILKMKMRGTGIVSGYWIVNNQPFEFFNETVYQGQIKTILTREIPGLPVFDPGMHTITVQLTRPESETVVFPTLRYFVLPYENEITTLTPRDGAIIKEDEMANFSWQNVLGGSYYQIAFANSLFPLLRDDPSEKWLDCPGGLNFIPDAETWSAIQRNKWTYWKVRGLDSNKNVLAASSVQEMKIIIPGAAVGIQKISDMDGNSIEFVNGITVSRADPLLLHGYLTYPAEAEYLILQVYANENKIDQLLFRDVKKEEKRFFETSVPNSEKESRILFQVLKSSSPSLIIGILELHLKKD
ncbi:MAG: PKD domain-containing protein [Candidatus Aminicenantes bacterium]|nr:PKD domain-containing protein [Candidatus Aminicenantes bacterium]